MKASTSVAELNLLIRTHAASLAACRYCVIGDVYAHAPDDSGCNWGVSSLQGSGCFDCLTELKPFLESLYAKFDLTPESPGSPGPRI